MTESLNIHKYIHKCNISVCSNGNGNENEIYIKYLLSNLQLELTFHVCFPKKLNPLIHIAEADKRSKAGKTDLEGRGIMAFC